MIKHFHTSIWMLQTTSIQVNIPTFTVYISTIESISAIELSQ